MAIVLDYARPEKRPSLPLELARGVFAGLCYAIIWAFPLAVGIGLGSFGGRAANQLLSPPPRAQHPGADTVQFTPGPPRRLPHQ